MEGGQGEQGRSAPAQRRAEEGGRTSCGEPGLEGGCGYRQEEKLGHGICFTGQVQGHHPHVLGLLGCRVPTLFSVTQDGSYNVPLAHGHPHVCESIKEQ